MKSTLFLITLFPFLSLAQGKTSDELLSKEFRKYPIEKAEIQYEISGDADGSETLIFEKYGWKSLRKIDMSFELYGINSSRHQYELTDGENLKRINHNDSTVRTRIDTKWSSLVKYKTPLEASEAILFSLGGTQKSDTTLLGKTCQVWTFEHKSIKEMWIWNGLVLKRISKLGDKLITTTASSIKTDIEIGKSDYLIPKEYKVLD